MTTIRTRSQLVDNVGPTPRLDESMHGTIIGEFPLVVRTANNHIVLASHSALPFASRSIKRLQCACTLELIRDDEAFLVEVARVLRADGVLDLTVPNAHGFGRLDHMNVYRYLSDMTNRGDRLKLLSEVGWRRHYSSDDLAAFLVSAGLQPFQMSTRGLGLEECIAFFRLVRMLWIQQRESLLTDSKTDAETWRFSLPTWVPIGMKGWSLHVTASPIPDTPSGPNIN